MYVVSLGKFCFFVNHKNKQFPEIHRNLMVYNKSCFGDLNQNLIRQIQFELAIGDLASG